MTDGNDAPLDGEFLGDFDGYMYIHQLSGTSDLVIKIGGEKVSQILNNDNTFVFNNGETAYGQEIEGFSYDEASNTYTIPLSVFEAAASDLTWLNTWYGIEIDQTKTYYAPFVDVISGDQHILLFVGESGGTTVDKSSLLSTIANAPADGYHTEADRFNGKAASKTGFWADYSAALENARSIAENSSASQEQVDAANTALQSAISNLIPIERVNPTALYEVLTTDWRWHDTGSAVVEVQPGYGNWEKPSADNCTAITWGPYAKAREEAQALFDSLYDEDGRPTDANTVSVQEQANALAAAANPSALVNTQYYTSYYNTYSGRREEARSLLELYDPDKMTESDYSPDSWTAYTEAYAALKADMAYTVVGGTKADLAMLVGFPNHIETLKDARKQLSSTVDIEISFTYINNFAAKYPSIRESGTDLYVNEALKLTSGNTTLAKALAAANVQFDKKDIGDELPKGWENKSDTEVLLAIYINGESYGVLTEYVLLNVADYDIQLHQGDQVRIVRVPAQISKVEASSGYDSTQITEGFANSSEYRSSIAMIHMTAPGGTVKVGDKAVFSAAVTGADVTNFGSAMSAENITLFVSEPGENQVLAQPATKTTAVTGADGSLEYVFTQPGWHTVAMFNVQDDVPTFTDVFNAVTYGEYYSLYAGDYAMVYVAPADDEKALITQYRSEYLAEAAAYFEPFHDYDFEEGYYEGTFKGQYDALVSNLESADSFKVLKDSFDADFTALKEYGANAIDHAGVIEGLLQDMEYLPGDLASMDESYSALVSRIKTVYDGLNAHQRTLLTGQQTQLLEQLKTVVLKDLASVTVQITVDGSLPSKRTSSDTGNPAMGWPDLTWNMHTEPDGTIPTPRWDGLSYTPQGHTLSAKAGDYVYVRRYLNTTDDAYWMVWSVDGGTTWNLSEPQTLGVYSGYYLATYQVPEDVQNGGTIAMQLKMLSKDEYTKLVTEQDAQGLEAAKESALAAIQAAYDGYDLSKYDKDGKAALLKALEDGKTAVQSATTKDAVTQARRDAIAAMAAVKTVEEIALTGKVSYDSGKTVGRVHVIIENTTYSPGPFYGKGSIADGWYSLGENDTMMTMVLKVLQSKGYTWNGTVDFGDDNVADYSITYLAGVSKDLNNNNKIDEGETLAEFTGGQKSGWMGTLNDWFTNEGFQAFSVANGQLENNDEIHIMYTCAYGEDINGTWRANSLTTLDELTVTGGTLTPGFSSNTKDYMLVIAGNRANVVVHPVPTNKNYQYRIFLNEYNKDSAMYKRTETISVADGDVLYVGVGEQGWPTMNTSGSPTKYTIKVYSLAEAIKNLPDASKVNSSNYATYEETVKQMESLIKQQGYTGDRSRLDALKARVTFFSEIDAVKTLLDSIPEKDKLKTSDKSKVENARRAYDKLSAEQQLYITLSDVSKYNAAVEWLMSQGIAVTGGGVITKSEDEEAVSEVIALIEAIGEVTEDSGPKITAARKAYDALTSEQKKLVSNYKTLTDAEEAYARLDKKPELELPFIDVDGHWALEGIQYVYDKGLMAGVGNNRFDPDGTLNRAMLVTILHKLEGTPAVESSGASYEDVPEDSWYADAVAWATENKIVSGYGNGMFGPLDDITREQMAVVLMHYTQYKKYDASKTTNLSGYTDVNRISDWALEAVKWANAEGLINGRTATTLEPEGTATRAEAATILMNYLENVAKEE